MAKRVREIIPEVRKFQTTGGRIQVHSMFESHHKAQILEDLSLALQEFWASDRSKRQEAEEKWSSYVYKDARNRTKIHESDQLIKRRTNCEPSEEDSLYGDLIKLYPTFVSRGAQEQTAEITHEFLNAIEKWKINPPTIADMARATHPLRGSLLQILNKQGLEPSVLTNMDVEQSQMNLKRAIPLLLRT